MSETATSENASENASVFVTSTGFTLKLKPVSPFLIQKVQTSMPEPPAPTYTVTTAAGNVETHTHDAESIKDAPDTDKEAWVKYITELRAQQSEVNDRLVRLIILRGIESDVPEYGWDRAQEDLGVTVPKDPNERKVHYILTETIGTAEDMANLITNVIALSGVNQEAVEAARSTFRNSLRRNGSTPAANSKPLPLDAQPAVSGD